MYASGRQRWKSCRERKEGRDEGTGRGGEGWGGEEMEIVKGRREKSGGRERGRSLREMGGKGKRGGK